MELEQCAVGKKLRVVRLTEGYSNAEMGFAPGDEVTVSGYSFHAQQREPQEQHIAVTRWNGMIGVFDPADLMEDPAVGDRVRSHDFNNVGEPRLPGRNPCYIEGVVRAIVEEHGCPLYDIEIERRMWDGAYDAAEKGQSVRAPVNGMINPTGDTIYRVEKI